MPKDMLRNNFLISKIKLPILNQLYKDIFLGGKGVRLRLVRDISECLGLAKEDISLLGECVESIHYSSLLHDDVIDVSKFRRNRIATWVKFSQVEAILAGDYLMAQVMFRVSNTSNVPLTKLTSETVANMVQGELLQRTVRGQETLKDLDRVHTLKTSALFEWGVRAPFLLRNFNHPELQNLLQKIGIIFGQLFQRADDLMDFGICNGENKKEFQDLKGGYLNFFGTYLKEQKAVKSDKTLRACRNLLQLKKCVGEKNLEKHIQSFDQMNQKLIDTCQNYIEKMKSYLAPNQQDVLTRLSSWAHSLYSR